MVGYIILALLLVAAAAWLLTAAGYFRALLVRPNAKRKQTDGALAGPLADFIADNNAAAEQIEALGIAQKIQMRAVDGTLLRARLLPAKEKSNKYALCVHGYKSSGLGDFGAIGLQLWQQGYNVLLVDDRAHGESGGKYIGMGVLDSDDVLAWCQYLVLQKGRDTEIVLHGMSMGAATVLMAAAKPSLPVQVKGVVADCGFSDGLRLIPVLVNMKAKGAVQRLLLRTVNGFAKFFAGYSLYDARPLAHVSNIHIPVLFIHGAADDYVPTEMVHELYAACKAPKRLYIAEGAWHACSFVVDKAAYTAQLNAFYSEISF